MSSLIYLLDKFYTISVLAENENIINRKVRERYFLEKLRDVHLDIH